MTRPKIGFLGAGAMSQAILAGMLASGRYPPDDLVLAGRSATRLEAVCTRFGLRSAGSVAELAAESDVLVLCIKPKDLASVAGGLDGVDLSGKLVVSTLAGVNVAALSSAFPLARVVRAIPNIAAETGTGVTLWCVPGDTPSEAVDLAEQLWSSVGTSIQVTDEALIDYGTPISGAAPAFLSLFVEAMVDAAVRLGIPWDTASQLVLNALRGSCDLVEREDYQTHRVRQRVTSPGGLTASAMAQLEASGLRQAIMNAVLAGHSRTLELGGQQNRM